MARLHANVLFCLAALKELLVVSFTKGRSRQLHTTGTTRSSTSEPDKTTSSIKERIALNLELHVATKNVTGTWLCFNGRLVLFFVRRFVSRWPVYFSSKPQFGDILFA